MSFKQFRKQLRLKLPRLAAAELWIKRRLRPRRTPVERFAGKVRGSDATIAVLCGLTGPIRHHVLQLTFSSPLPAPANWGLLNLQKVFRSTRRLQPAADLVFMPADEPQHSWMDDGSWFYIPQWVQGQIMLPLPEAVRRDDSIKSTSRVIFRHGYEYIATRDEKLFYEFYHRMHAPYIRSNFGDGACLETFEQKLAHRGNFELLLLRKKSRPGEYLAGFLIVYEPTSPRLWSLGVRDGDIGLVREGVIAALYQFAVEFLTGRGFTSVNLGGSRPFLHDGVLNFKRRRAQRLTGCRAEGFSLKILRLTPGVKDFLCLNPFIFRSRGCLHGAIFAEAPLTKDGIHELHRRFYHPGLGRLIIWIFTAGNEAVLPSLPPELAGLVELRLASELPGQKIHLP